MAALNSSRVPALGTKLQKWADTDVPSLSEMQGSANWDDVGGVIDFTPPQTSVESIDETELDPYAGTTLPAEPIFYTTSQPGFRTSGEYQFNLNYHEDAYAYFKNLLDKGLYCWIRLRYRNNYSDVAYCWVSACSRQSTDKSKLAMLQVTLVVRGAETHVQNS